LKTRLALTVGSTVLPLSESRRTHLFGETGRWEAVVNRGIRLIDLIIALGDNPPSAAEADHELLSCPVRYNL
jgi:hypothetical protein